MGKQPSHRAKISHCLSLTKWGVKARYPSRIYTQHHLPKRAVFVARAVSLTDFCPNCISTGYPQIGTEQCRSPMTRAGAERSFCFLKKNNKGGGENNNYNWTCLGSVMTLLMECTLYSETQTFYKIQIFSEGFLDFFMGAGNISAPVLHPCRSPRGSAGSEAARSGGGRCRRWRAGRRRRRHRRRTRSNCTQSRLSPCCQSSSSQIVSWLQQKWWCRDLEEIGAVGWITTCQFFILN